MSKASIPAVIGQWLLGTILMCLVVAAATGIINLIYIAWTGR